MTGEGPNSPAGASAHVHAHMHADRFRHGRFSSRSDDTEEKDVLGGSSAKTDGACKEGSGEDTDDEKIRPPSGASPARTAQRSSDGGH